MPHTVVTAGDIPPQDFEVPAVRSSVAKDFITKQVGDIAEAAVLLAARKRGYEVLSPFGDRLAYDLVFDLDGILIKVQVKSAWFDSRADAYCVDVRRTKTNRRRMVRARYSAEDFDFAIAYLPTVDAFYVMPVAFFISFSGPISFVEASKRQRAPRSTAYREAWQLLEEFAAQAAITQPCSDNRLRV